MKKKMKIRNFIYFAVITAITVLIGSTVDAGVALASAVLAGAVAPGAFTSRLKELRDRNGEINERLAEISQTAQTEERYLNNNETTEYQKLVKELKANRSELQGLEAVEENNKLKAKHSINIRTSGEKHNGQYSFLKFLREIIPGNGGLTGFEAEMHQELRAAYKNQGLQAAKGYLAPINGLFQKRDLTTTPDTAGGFLIDTETRELIQFLRNQTVLGQMGAMFLTGLVGNISWPRRDTRGGFSWETETGTKAESSGSFDNVPLSPKRGSMHFGVSEQLLNQSSLDVESELRNEILQVVREGVETAAINGGGVNEPSGIIDQVVTNIVEFGTPDGGPVTWAKIVEMETKANASNAPRRNLGYLTNSKVIGEMKSTEKSSTSGKYIYSDTNNERPVNNHITMDTNLVPDNLTKGAGTDLSAAIYGDFSELIIGQWGALNIIADPYTLAADAKIRYISNSYWDVALKHEESFAVGKDIVTI